MRSPALRIILVSTAVVTATAASALTLSGINGFPTDASGNWHTGWYNTYGGSDDIGKNGYVIAAADTQGSFLNSGNSAQTSISFDLNTPGTYNFLVFWDGEEIFAGRDFWGLNLFFNGNNSAAGISAFAQPQGSDRPESPQYWANGGLTLTLDGKSSIFGTGSTVFQDGDKSVALTRYVTNKSSVYQLDRVDNWSIRTSGRNDHVTEFTLQVVPEPATLGALGTGILALTRMRRRRR